MAKKTPPAPIDTSGMSFGQRLFTEWNQQRKKGLTGRRIEGANSAIQQ